MNRHEESCDVGFEKSGNGKECYYYRRGECLKGDLCSFKHQETIERTQTPKCRNGSRCRYFANGVCVFYHPGVGVQKPKLNESFQGQEDRVWCRFAEDCFNVPNCPFIHDDQDFPELKKHNTPPIESKRLINAWMDY